MIKFVTEFGFFGEKVFDRAIFVWVDGYIYENPTILEEDGDLVIIKHPFTGEELIGRAVHQNFLTKEEALEISKQFRVNLMLGDHMYGHSAKGVWCYWFMKQRGTKLWGRPVSTKEALELAEGTKELRYWTRSHRTELVSVK